jgi:hypothetical protein
MPKTGGTKSISEKHNEGEEWNECSKVSITQLQMMVLDQKKTESRISFTGHVAASMICKASIAAKIGRPPKVVQNVGSLEAL